MFLLHHGITNMLYLKFHLLSEVIKLQLKHFSFAKTDWPSFSWDDRSFFRGTKASIDSGVVFVLTWASIFASWTCSSTCFSIYPIRNVANQTSTLYQMHLKLLLYMVEIIAFSQIFHVHSHKLYVDMLVLNDWCIISVALHKALFHKVNFLFRPLNLVISTWRWFNKNSSFLQFCSSSQMQPDWQVDCFWNKDHNVLVRTTD